MRNGFAILRRYLRLFVHFVAFSFSRTFEFRFDFYMRIIMDIFYYTVSISFFKIIFLHTPTVAGWDEPMMMIFVAGYCMVDAINMTLFANNMWQLPNLVNSGGLDYYLIRPASTLFFLSLRDFAANSFLNLVITLGIFAWAVLRYPLPLPAWKIAVFLLMIANGSFIFYCLNMLMNMNVFFSHSGQGFGPMVWNLMKLGERPDRIYSGWIRRVLTTVLPFAVIASFPARLLIEEFDPMVLIHALAVSATLFSALLFIWNKGLKNYSSASS